MEGQVEGMYRDFNYNMICNSKQNNQSVNNLNFISLEMVGA